MWPTIPQIRTDEKSLPKQQVFHESPQSVYKQPAVRKWRLFMDSAPPYPPPNLGRMPQLPAPSLATGLLVNKPRSAWSPRRTWHQRRTCSARHMCCVCLHAVDMLWHGGLRCAGLTENGKFLYLTGSWDCHRPGGTSFFWGRKALAS